MTINISRAAGTALSLIPMALMLAATGIVAQIGNASRLATTPDDALLPPLMQSIHPAALWALLIGYLISIAVIVLGLIGTRPESPGKIDVPLSFNQKQSSNKLA